MVLIEMIYLIIFKFFHFDEKFASINYMNEKLHQNKHYINSKKDLNKYKLIE